MDRVFFFFEAGRAPAQCSPLQQLAFVGDRGTGALFYEPEFDDGGSRASETAAEITLETLGREAQQIFEEKTKTLRPELLESGFATGSRPKSLLWVSSDFRSFSTKPVPKSEAWLVKFTSSEFMLKHEEGIWEAACMKAAQLAGIHVAQWQLFDGVHGKGLPEAPYWLGMKRFDRTPTGCMHFQSAAGLLDADFRLPTLDYQDLVRVLVALGCREDVEELILRAIFNFFIRNEDDYAKNFGFLMDDEGRWRLSPAFDLTYSPTAYGEHATSFAGEGRKLSRTAIERMAEVTGLSISALRSLSERAAAGAERAGEFARDLGAKPGTVKRIDAVIKKAIQANLQAFR